MARKSRKNVQATPAVVVGPVQYKVALYARISVENEQKREADTIGNQIALLKDFVSQHQDLVVFDLYLDTTRIDLCQSRQTGGLSSGF